MANEPATSSPAGEGLPAQGALDIDGAVALLNQADEDERKEKEKPEAPAAAGQEVEPAEEAEPEAEEVPDEPSPDEGGEPEADEGEAEEEVYVHGNARTRLRDGTVTTVGELKKLAEKAREYEQQGVPGSAELEQARTQIQREAQVLNELLPLAVQVVKGSIPEPPAEELWQDDPIAALQQQRAHDAAVAKFQRLQGGQQHLSGQTEAEQEKTKKEFIAEQQKQLLKVKPELKDPKAAEVFYRDRVLAGATGVGFSEEDVSTVYDHRLILLAEKAALWDQHQVELQKARPKVDQKLKGAGPIQAPTRRVAARQEREVAIEAARKRFDKSPSIDDAVALLNLINPG